MGGAESKGLKMVPGTVVRTQSNIHDGAFSENREQFLAVNYFHKKYRQYMGQSIQKWTK